MLSPVPESFDKFLHISLGLIPKEGSDAALSGQNLPDSVGFSVVRLVSGGVMALFNDVRKDLLVGMYFSSYNPDDGMTNSMGFGRCECRDPTGDALHLLLLEPNGDNKYILPFRDQMAPFARFRDQAIFSILQGRCKDIAVVKSTDEVLVAESKNTGPNGDKNHALVVVEKSRLEEMFKDKQFTPEYASELVSTELQKDMLAIMARMNEKIKD